MTTGQLYDFAIIGGGIAGASVGAALAPHSSVILLEAEDSPGYHSTGRSAAFWHETLGGPQVQKLSLASLPTLRDNGFLSPRKSLNVGQAGDEHLLDDLLRRFEGSGAQLTRLDAAGIKRWVPRANDRLTAGVLEEICADIDVAGLHAHFLKLFRAGGGVIETGFRLSEAKREQRQWRLTSGSREVAARILVNAAGAWADAVGTLAGAVPLGIQPMRRTIAQVRVRTSDVPPDLPLTIDVAGKFYFKPEGADRLWVCPHDETPVEPGDAAPEELDVALAIDRFETVTDWRVAAVERKWAGLRSFAPDRLPVFGYDPYVEGLFWCAGQGGVGIQTSPAAGALCADLLLGRDPVVDAEPFAPARFA